MDEKKPKIADAISDEELRTITGGAILHMDGDRHYGYVGSYSDAASVVKKTLSAKPQDKAWSKRPSMRKLPHH